MRLLTSCSAALLALVLVVVACNTVDPNDCWVNTSGGFGGSGTIPIGAGVGVSSGDFISPPRFGPLGTGAPANPCVASGSDTAPAGAPTGAGGDASYFAGIDAQTLETESLKASAMAYYLDGALSVAGVDPSDSTAVAAFFAQDTPMAEMSVDNWLAADASAIPTAGVIPRYECTEDHGCPYKTKCFNGGPWNTGPSYECAVTGCGSSKCTACPDFFPPTLKSLVFDSWCSYTCAGRLPPRPIVAIGAVGMKDGKPFPSAAAGAWCFNP